MEYNKQVWIQYCIIWRRKL